MDDDMAVDIAVHFTLDICRLDGCHMDDDMAVDIAVHFTLDIVVSNALMTRVTCVVFTLLLTFVG